MGCDIHSVFQKKTDHGWLDIETNYNEDRHYFLFSWLADVRNGFGFAGVPTYQPITPISKPRGYPEDFGVINDDHYTFIEAVGPRRREWMDENEKKNPRIWMGDHSHSWLTAEEILSAPRPDGTWRTGIIDIDLFRRWDGHSQPSEWSGGITGPNIRIAESPIEVLDTTTHVRVYWKGGCDLDYFVNEVQRLQEEHKNVRMVFGFDS